MKELTNFYDFYKHESSVQKNFVFAAHDQAFSYALTEWSGMQSDDLHMHDMHVTPDCKIYLFYFLDTCFTVRVAEGVMVREKRAVPRKTHDHHDS